MDQNWSIEPVDSIKERPIDSTYFRPLHSHKIVPLGVQQLVTEGVPLKGHLCTLSTPKKCISVPVPLRYYYKSLRGK